MRILILLALFFSVGMGYAQKSDTLILNNGDRITGEIKELSLGYLSYGTDDAGTIKVKWIRIAFLESKNQFDITTENGVRHFGSLGRGDSAGYVKILSYTDTLQVPMTELVEISRIKNSFWNRIDGQITAGFSFTRANRNTQLNGGLNLNYRNVNTNHSASYSIIFNSANGQDENQRQDASYTFNWLFADNWYTISVAGFQQNIQLGLQARTFAALGFGHVIMHDNNNLFLGGVAATINEEQDLEGKGRLNSEGVLQVSYERFKVIGNSFNLATDISYYPSLTTTGRHRVDYNLQLLWEIIGDLKWNVTFKYSSDTKPASEDALKEDYSIVLGLSYSL